MILGKGDSGVFLFDESLSIVRIARDEMAIYSDLKGKAVLITRVTNGIGAAMAEAFCAQGTWVFWRRRLEIWRSFGQEAGGNATFSRVDLTKESQVRDCVEQAAR